MKMDSKKKYSQAMHSFLNREPVMLKEVKGTYPSRDNLHERVIFRTKK